MSLQIIDEKSLIKKYQHEIQRLKDELEQMKRGVVSIQPKETGEVDFVLLKQKVDDVILSDFVFFFGIFFWLKDGFQNVIFL